MKIRQFRFKICQIHTFSEGITVSGKPAYTFTITKNGRAPQKVSVLIDGESRQFLFGPYVSEKRINEQLPRLVMDSKFKPRKRKAV